LKIFETFSYDIIIILVLTISILLGIYFSLYRQLGNTLVLVIPFLLLYFLFNQIMEVYNRILGDTLFKNAAYRHLINAILVYIASFVLIGLVVKLIYRLFRPSVQKRVLHQPSKLSRAFGGILGMANGYLLCLILMFFLNPILKINQDDPLTKALNATSNQVLTLSKLNQYQAQYGEKYEEYKQALKLFSGEFALSKYKDIEEFLDVNNTNVELQTELLPLLSEQSVALIASHLTDNDYLRTLLKVVDGKIIFASILDSEKESSNYSEIKTHYDSLLYHQGYLFALDQYFEAEELNFENLNTVFQSHYQEVAAAFSEEYAKESFYEIAEAMAYLQENYQFFSGLLEVEAGSIPDYVQAAESLLQGNGLKEYSENLVKANASPLLKEIFGIYLRNSEKIEKLHPNLSLACKLVLVKDEKNWFAKPLWENQSLIKSYFLDALVTDSVSGHQLYQEYFLHCYLFSEHNSNVITGNDFLEAMERLEALVSEEKIDEDTARKLVGDLLNDSNSALSSFAIGPEFYDELRTIDHPYLSGTTN